MITDCKKWHYLAVKSFSALLRGVTSNHKGDFYWLNCFHSYSTKNKLKSVCQDRDYCYVEMHNEGNKILEYNRREWSMKHQFVIYAELECLLEKILSCKNDPQKSYAEKKNIKLLVIQCVIDAIKNKLACYRSKDCMKIFCRGLKEYVTKISNHEKNEMIPLTNEEKKIHCRQKKNVTYAKKDLVLMMIILKRITKSEIIVTTQENIEELLTTFVI